LAYSAKACWNSQNTTGQTVCVAVRRNRASCLISSIIWRKHGLYIKPCKVGKVTDSAVALVFQGSRFGHPGSFSFHFAFDVPGFNFAAMNPPNFRVRRATLEDVSALLQLWSSMRFDADALAKRATDFQVAEDSNKTILGAIGLQIVARQGCIHSEAFTDFSVADEVRPLFLDRLKALANNHGLIRLWTQENAPFWKHCGLEQADAQTLEKMPADWKALGSGWLTLKLKEDFEEILSGNAEFALFVEAEKRRTRKTLDQARLVKVIATGIAVLLLLGIVIAGIYLLRRNPHIALPGRQ
jgi:N-acetylglutamate synthase-like GNAT family acetyltransferase